MKLNTKFLKGFNSRFFYVPSDVFQRSVEMALWNLHNFRHPILEIGTGDGEISSYVFNKLGYIDVGIDISKEAGKKAKMMGFYKKVITQNAERLPFKNSFFNSVVCNSTIEHVGDDISLINEVSRVLRKGGWFAFTAPAKSFKDVLKPRLKPNEWTKLNERLNHKRYRSENEWKNILVDYSFKVYRVIKYIDKKQLWFWYILFKFSTSVPYKRELWSYLQNLMHSNIFFSRILELLVYYAISKPYQKAISGEGNFLFILAIKK